MRTRFSLVILSVLVLSLLSLSLQAGETPPAGPEGSKVLRLTFPKLVMGKYDAEAVLYYRDGAFHHGYALVPQRDNLAHRVDLTPPPAIQFVDTDGNVIEIPHTMRGNYSYKRKGFNDWKKKYYDEEISIHHPIPIKPLALKGETLAGDLDLLIHEVDEANTAGRNNHDLVYRLQINATVTKDGVTGEATSWQYHDQEDTYGTDAPRSTITVSGGWDDTYWTPKPGTAYTPGTDWPMAHGPHLTGSAAPYDGELIHNLHDAKLLWVAEDILPGGRSGGRTRGDFAMFPFAWKTIGYGGYGAPIIADGKVFVYVHTADLDAILKDPATARDPFVRLGLDPRALVEDQARDTVICFDAQTGKRLWRFLGKTRKLSRTSKGGMASTPCFYKGKLYVRGDSGLYCFDATTGEKLWQKGGEKNVGGYGIGAAAWEGSVVVIGNTLILMTSGGRHAPTKVIGLNPEDGSVKWHHNRIGGGGIGLPGKFIHEGKEYAVCGREAYGPHKRDKDAKPTPDNFVMIDPADGTILWESDALRNTEAQLLVWKEFAVGNVTPDLLKIKKKPSEATRVGAARITLDGATPLWKSDSIMFKGIRTLNVLHDGIAYIDDRKKFAAFDLETGKKLGQLPHIYHMTQGSHNWTWHVATNDRIITSGVAMFTTADKGFSILPGRLSLDITSGYRAPIKPAVADGRIVLRLADKLVCYDLRQSRDYDTEVIELVAKNVIVGTTPERSPDVEIRIRKDGDALISLGAKWDKMAGSEQWAVAYWAGSWTGAYPWRKSIPHELTLTDTSLKGPAIVRLGWQWEPFEFDLTREGNRFTGTYTRIVPPLPTPIPTKGDVMGTHVNRDDGTRFFNNYMINGCANVDGLAEGKANQNLTLVVVCKGDEIQNAWAVCGKINTVMHEVDPSKLNVEGNHLTGTATVIFHDDQYMDLRPEYAAKSYRRAAHGPALAATFTLDVTANPENKLTGSHEGTIGIEWKLSGKIEGELKPDAAP